ncbi:MAG: hypothetical protein JWN30_90 [Bacilli bacterium]|nr:hypothetical protein [Bacilli bacterium]
MKLWTENNRSLLLFCIVGGSGTVLNLLIFYLLHARLGMQEIVASLIAAVIAMTSNFLLNDSVTWRGDKRGTTASRYLRFVAVSSVGIGINLIVLYLLDRFAGINATLANAIGIAIATIWNYALNKFWTFRKVHSKARVTAEKVRTSMTEPKL